jgi:hypothetical protein
MLPPYLLLIDVFRDSVENSTFYYFPTLTIGNISNSYSEFSRRLEFLRILIAFALFFLIFWR